MPETQGLLGLELEPTIAMRRGDAYVVQCTCGALLAVPIPYGRLAPHQLGDCPACGQGRGWSQQHVPVGPFTAHWAHDLVGAAFAVADDPSRVEELRRAIARARSITRELKPWLSR